MSEPIDMVPTIRQRLFWDILPCDQVGYYWDTTGLVPPGPDVAEIAHRESHARLQKVAPLAEVCEMYIVLTADMITEVMFKQVLSQVDTDDPRIQDTAQQVHDTMLTQNREVVRGSLYSTLAHLIDGGLLTVNTQPRVVTR